MVLEEFLYLLVCKSVARLPWPDWDDPRDEYCRLPRVRRDLGSVTLSRWPIAANKRSWRKGATALFCETDPIEQYYIFINHSDITDRVVLDWSLLTRLLSDYLDDATVLTILLFTTKPFFNDIELCIVAPQVAINTKRCLRLRKVIIPTCYFRNKNVGIFYTGSGGIFCNVQPP